MVPLCGGDVVSFKDVKQRVFVVQLELELLSRTVLLLSQEKTQQRLTLQCCDILEGKINVQLKGRKATQSSEKPQNKKCEYLAGSVGVQDFIFNDEPQSFPLLLVAF